MAQMVERQSELTTSFSYIKNTWKCFKKTELQVKLDKQLVKIYHHKKL